jgi:hypothetical protein
VNAKISPAPNAPTRGLAGLGNLDIQSHDDGTLVGRYNGDQFIVIALDGWELDFFIDIWDDSFR